MPLYLWYVHESLRRFWWDVVVKRDDTWMRNNNGYMFIAIYLMCITLVLSTYSLM